MVEPGSKRIPISFSPEDFHLLYRVQEGYLYTGKSRDKMWQLADIIKAMVIDTWIDIFHRDSENFSYSRLLPFTAGHRGSKYAKNQEEYNTIITSYFASLNRNTGAMKALEKKDKIPKTSFSINAKFWEDHIISHIIGNEKPIHDDRTKTNFIVTLNEYELEVFDDVKYAIQAFIQTTISYSEMVRGIFKNLLYTDTFLTNSFKNYFLSSIYIGALYDFSPQDSIMIFSKLTSVDHILINQDSWYILKSADRDYDIFLDYYGEISGLLKKQPKLTEKELATNYNDIVDFSDILNNLYLERKFRSSINNFNFHSAFIGFTLILMEWTYSQHNLSLIATYLSGTLKINNSKGTVKENFGIEFTTRAFFDVFYPQMDILYDLSMEKAGW